MATKWLAFLMFFIQVEYLSCCVFDQVKGLEINSPYLKHLFTNKNECLAACYARKKCFAVLYMKGNNECYLYKKGETPIDCAGDTRECYILQRDEVDPVCKTFVNF